MGNTVLGWQIVRYVIRKLGSRSSCTILISVLLLCQMPSNHDVTTISFDFK